jgi:hypothetical protein
MDGDGFGIAQKERLVGTGGDVDRAQQGGIPHAADRLIGVTREIEDVDAPPSGISNPHPVAAVRAADRARTVHALWFALPDDELAECPDEPARSLDIG